MSNIWRASDPSGKTVEFLSRDGIDPYVLVHKDGLEVPITIVDHTDGDKPVATIEQGELDDAQRLVVTWQTYVDAVEAEVARTARAYGPEAVTIRIVRGQLGGKPWGYDIVRDGEHARLNHVGSLGEAEQYAGGYAAGIHDGTGADVEVRIGPEGMSTVRADLGPGS